MVKFKGLITDKGTDEISIGKVLLFFCFGFLSFYWASYTLAMKAGMTPPDAPQSLVTITVALLGYIVFQKSKEVIKHHIDIRNGIVDLNEGGEKKSCK